MTITQVFASRVVTSLLISLVWALTVAGALMAYLGVRTILWDALPVEIVLYIVLTVALFVLTNTQNRVLMRHASYRQIEKSLKEIVDG